MARKKVTLTPKDLESGRIFASQDWVEGGIPSRSEPIVYTVIYKRRTYYLVGDGHKRICKALEEGHSIKCEIDSNLGNISDKHLNDQREAQQRFASHGISGIWPLSVLIGKRKSKEG